MTAVNHMIIGTDFAWQSSGSSLSHWWCSQCVGPSPGHWRLSFQCEAGTSVLSSISSSVMSSAELNTFGNESHDIFKLSSRAPSLLTSCCNWHWPGSQIKFFSLWQIMSSADKRTLDINPSLSFKPATHDWCTAETGYTSTRQAEPWACWDRRILKISCDCELSTSGRG